MHPQKRSGSVNADQSTQVATAALPEQNSSILIGAIPPLDRGNQFLAKKHLEGRSPTLVRARIRRRAGEIEAALVDRRIERSIGDANHNGIWNSGIVV